MSENTQSGVYTIVNAVTGDAYIGSSVDMPVRMSRHRALLAAGRHYNSRLQVDWNAFGENTFLFDVLEVVEDHSLLVAVEQRYLDERKPAYNLARIATNAAAGVGHQKRLQEDRERAIHLRMVVAQEAVKLRERLERYDDIGNMLLTIQELSFSGLMIVYVNRDLAVTAYRSGVLSGRDFVEFLDFGYRGLYHETHAQIHERKGLKRTQDISDYMGSMETAANIFRAALARQLMDDRAVTETPAANATHYEAGDSVRELLVSKGIVPEQLPTPRTSFQQLMREEEARQRLLAEHRAGLWAQLDDGDDSEDAEADGEAHE